MSAADGTTERVKEAILAELDRQHEAMCDGPYVYDCSFESVGIDGHLYLDPLAEAVVKAAAGWQPIETAPKDGTNVLLARPHGAPPTVAFWNEHTFGWDGDYWCGMLGFTHWMPLPDPPDVK